MSIEDRCRSNCQYLWDQDLLGGFRWRPSAASSSGRSTSLPLTKMSPRGRARPGGGASTMRQRRWADSISLKAIARAAALDPWPGDLRPQPDRGEHRLDRVGSAQITSAPPVVIERQQLLLIPGGLGGGRRPWGTSPRSGRRRPSRPCARGPCPRRSRSPPGLSSAPGERTSAATEHASRSCGPSSAGSRPAGTTSGPLSRPRAPVADRQHRGAHGRRAQSRAGRPTTRRTTVAVGQRHQLARRRRAPRSSPAGTARPRPAGCRGGSV